MTSPITRLGQFFAALRALFAYVQGLRRRWYPSDKFRTLRQQRS